MLKSNRAVTRGVFALSLLLALGVAPAAKAMSCQRWNRLGPAEKSQELDRLIAQVVRSNAGRQYTSVQRSRVERCLHSSARTIEYEFDDICDSSRAGMNALQVMFKRYIWDCLH